MLPIINRRWGCRRAWHVACGTGPSEHEAIMAFIPPGQPWHNGVVESLHNRMRDELREDNLIEDLTRARVMVDW